ncbi:hypothetical protein BDZ94DRAFT_1234481 [Collybia nuda]|uniref:Uncharacterized protein n=1 Tax=Collybia nuda TaxID=64659 RepID=A0A9P5YBB1_9AGAR|nr:hypothetical protein BDZ94DRAFT_1234481 [Collybia nuda]
MGLGAVYKYLIRWFPGNEKRLTVILVQRDVSTIQEFSDGKMLPSITSNFDEGREVPSSAARLFLVPLILASSIVRRSCVRARDSSGWAWGPTGVVSIFMSGLPWQRTPKISLTDCVSLGYRTPGCDASPPLAATHVGFFSAQDKCWGGESLGGEWEHMSRSCPPKYASEAEAGSLGGVVSGGVNHNSLTSSEGSLFGAGGVSIVHDPRNGPNHRSSDGKNCGWVCRVWKPKIPKWGSDAAVCLPSERWGKMDRVECSPAKAAVGILDNEFTRALKTPNFCMSLNNHKQRVPRRGRSRVAARQVDGGNMTVLGLPHTNSPWKVSKRLEQRSEKEHSVVKKDSSVQIIRERGLRILRDHEVDMCRHVDGLHYVYVSGMRRGRVILGDLGDRVRRECPGCWCGSQIGY